MWETENCKKTSNKLPGRFHNSKSQQFTWQNVSPFSDHNWYVRILCICKMWTRFSLNRPLGPQALCRFSHRVAMFICLSVWGGHRKTPFSKGREDLWLKNIFQILACDEKFSKKSGAFFHKIVKTRGFGPPNKTPTSRCRGELWSKNVFLILVCDHTIKKMHSLIGG